VGTKHLHVVHDRRPTNALLQHIAAAGPFEELPVAVDRGEPPIGEDRLYAFERSVDKLLDHNGLRLARSGAIGLLRAPSAKRFELPLISNAVHAGARGSGRCFDNAYAVCTQQHLAMFEQLLTCPSQERGGLAQADCCERARQGTLCLHCFKGVERCDGYRRTRGRP